MKLKVFKPVGADDRDVPEIGETPLGIVEQGRVQRTGDIEPLAGDARPLAPRCRATTARSSTRSCPRAT